jgi:hypothetical protein
MSGAAQFPDRLPGGEELLSMAKSAPTSPKITQASLKPQQLARKVKKITGDAGAISAKIERTVANLSKGVKTDILDILKDLRRIDPTTLKHVKLPEVKSQADFKNSVEFLKAVALYAGKEVANQLSVTSNTLNQKLTKDNAAQLLSFADWDIFAEVAGKFSKLTDKEIENVLSSNTSVLDDLLSNLKKLPAELKQKVENIEVLINKVEVAVKEKNEILQGIFEISNSLYSGKGLQQIPYSGAFTTDFQTLHISINEIVNKFDELDQRTKEGVFNNIKAKRDMLDLMSRPQHKDTDRRALEMTRTFNTLLGALERRMF